MRTLVKTAYDMSHVKSVAAWCLLNKDHKDTGRVVWNWSDNTNGSTVTCTLSLFDRSLSTTGRAGGSGYCKGSAAFADALDRADLNEYNEPGHVSISGVGRSACRDWLESQGYLVHEILSF